MLVVINCSVIDANYGPSHWELVKLWSLQVVESHMVIKGAYVDHGSQGRGRQQECMKLACVGSGE